MSATPLRRSARIAALKATRKPARNVPSAPLKAERPMRPHRMADVDIDRQVFMELLYDEDNAKSSTELFQARVNYLQFLEENRYLFDFLEEDALNQIFEAMNDHVWPGSMFFDMERALRRIRINKMYE